MIFRSSWDPRPVNSTSRGLLSNLGGITVETMAPISEEKLAEYFRINCKAFRELRRMTQAALAKAARDTQSHISDLENGRTNPSLKTIARVGSALGVAPWVLIAPPQRPQGQRSARARLLRTR